MHPRFLESNFIKGEFMHFAKCRGLRSQEPPSNQRIGEVVSGFLPRRGGRVILAFIGDFGARSLEAPEFKGEVAAPCLAELASPCFCL